MYITAAFYTLMPTCVLLCVTLASLVSLALFSFSVHARRQQIVMYFTNSAPSTNTITTETSIWILDGLILIFSMLHYPFFTFAHPVQCKVVRADYGICHGSQEYSFQKTTLPKTTLQH